MVDAREILKSICADANCMDALSGVYEFFHWLEELIEQLPKPRVSGVEQPLVQNVKNREEIAARLRVLGVEDEDVVDYVVARLVSRHHRELVDEHYREASPGGVCPVCGQVPTLLVVREKPALGFAALEVGARCICGYEKPMEGLTCPRCGETSYDSFKVLVAPQGLLRVFECSRCGHRFAEVRGDAFGERELQAFHGAVRLLLKLRDGEQ
uniref:Formate dehydrogenase accessory protein FdhE n=1 Tax=Thermofilum pendens TaxID=2269 RepID=A0A7C4B8X6_THEPE